MRLVMGGDGRRAASRHGFAIVCSTSGYRLKMRKGMKGGKVAEVAGQIPCLAILPAG